MSRGTLANRSDATLRKTIASGCLPRATPAHAELAVRASDPMYDYVEAVQRKFDKSEQEMSGLLGIAPSNYTRRSYNVARVQRLPENMRQLFVQYFAAGEGLNVAMATPHEQIKVAAKLAIINLLDLLEG